MKTCEIKDCMNNVVAKGLCGMHYQRMKRNGSPTTLKHRSVCKVDGCHRKHSSIGYCSKHYRRVVKHGDPNIDIGAGAKTKKIEFYQDRNGCFICTSHNNKNRGYKLIRLNNQIDYIHRFIYKECFGEIPDGMVVRHKCDNPSCINPDHLEIGTTQENSRDMVERNRSLKGSKNKRAKLNESQVYEIKRLLKTHKVADVARRFNVNPGIISNIKVGRTWKHLEHTTEESYEKFFLGSGKSDK